MLRSVIESMMMMMMMMIMSFENMFPRSVIADINLLIGISCNNPSSLILLVYRRRKFI
jgi:hypothetical protein